MEVNQLERSFKDHMESCYILSGNAAYYIDKAMKIFNSLVSDDFKDFNYGDYSGATCVDEVFFAAQTMPMMSQFRLVVWDVEIPTAAQSKTIADRLKAYLKAPQESSVLVIRDTESKLSAIYKNVTVIMCKDIIGFDATREAQNIMQELGMSGDGMSTKELLDRCNGNFSIFVCELNKIMQYSGGNVINMQLIDECVPRSIQHSVFKISDNIVARNTNKVFEIVKDLMNRQQEPLAILGALTKFFRQCFYLKISKMYKEEFISTFAIKEFQYTKLVKAAEGYKPTELKALLEMLEVIEYKIKSGAMTPTDAINLAVCRLTI